MSQDPIASDDDAKLITVFGAGIAGLTAAHELVDRGFRVEVIDRDPLAREDAINLGAHPGARHLVPPQTASPPKPAPCAVGGMARSQWCYVAAPFVPAESRGRILPAEFLEEWSTFSPSMRAPDHPRDMREASSRRLSVTSEGTPLLVCFEQDSTDPKNPQGLSDVVKSVLRCLKANPEWQVSVVARAMVSDPNPIESARKNYDLAWRRAKMFQDFFGDALTEEVRLDNTLLERDERGLGLQDRLVLFFDPDYQPRIVMGATTSDERANSIEIDVLQAVLAGEHGFRFFPSFYRHVFDTMKRIPITGMTRQDSEIGGGANTYDNLIPTGALGIGLGKGRARSFVVERHFPRSFEEIREFYQRSIDRLGHTPRDIARMELALWKYLTSCKDCRESEYEHLSWSDFIGLDQFSPQAQRDLGNMPQIISALGGVGSDARTQGTITLQLLFDQFTQGEHADGTLNGPTSDAWFRHWRAYLEERGVHFKQGEIVDIEEVDASDSRGTENPLRPIVSFATGKRRLSRLAYVLALSLPSAVDLCSRVNSHLRERDDLPDFRALLGFCNKDIDADLSRETPEGPLKHLFGIQYFFTRKIQFPPGHTLYLQAPWGLTSISQRQYWHAAPKENDKCQSILSVDIATVGRPGVGVAKTAWGCTKQEIAEEVWRQITDAFAEGFDDAAVARDGLPIPTYFHLDDNICGEPRTNRTPFLVNRTSEYRKRPGTPGHYHLNGRRWVIAGTFMQTFTRVTSMEAANESARHAVNALLESDLFNFKGTLCSIWDPEDHEVDDVRRWLELDHELWLQGAPHVVDILGLDRVPDLLPSDLDHPPTRYTQKPPSSVA